MSDSEATRIKDALEALTQLTWEGLDIDGGDFHEVMVKYGLFVEVPASDEFREEWDSDTMFVLAWDHRAADAVRYQDASEGEETHG